MAKRLDGKVALITGGAAGIGLETAAVFLREGAKVAIVDINEEDLKKAEEKLSEYGEVISVQADVSNEEEVKNYVEKTTEKFGTIDVFFNNAGVQGGFDPITELSLEDFTKVQKVNVDGVFLGMKHVLPVMTENKKGSIINTSSGAGFIGLPNMAAYSASKHAVIGLTKTAALEVADTEVRVNSIHPSAIDTNMMRLIESGQDKDDPDSVKEAYEQGIPKGHYGEADDVAKLALFLGSDESTFITGSQYRIDGGQSAQ